MVRKSESSKDQRKFLRRLNVMLGRRQKFRQRLDAMLIKHKFQEADLESLVQFSMENNLDLKRSIYIYRLWKFRQRLDAMLIRHKFRDPDSSDLVQFAIKNNLDTTRSTYIYKLYTIDKIERQLQQLKEEQSTEFPEQVEVEVEDPKNIKEEVNCLVM